MTATQMIWPSGGTRRSRPMPPQGPLVPIGDIAREFNVTLRTLRFYEAKGLLTPHRDGTARLYRAEDRAKLARILQGKRLGFTLGEIRDLVAGKGSATEALPLNRDQIRSQIGHLERQKASIDEAIAQLKEAHAKLATAD